jgi:hypothetical protein
VVDGIAFRRSAKAWLTSAGVFFQRGTHCVLCNTEGTADISDSTAVQRLRLDLLFGSGQPGGIGVFPLKTSVAGVTTIPLGAIFTMPIFDQIIMVTIRTVYMNILFHPQFPSIVDMYDTLSTWIHFLYN